MSVLNSRIYHLFWELRPFDKIALKILDMKSLGRGESQSLIDAYRGITGNNIETENDQYSLKKLERLIKNRL